MRFQADSFLEQLIERRAGVCRSTGGGLALDYRSWDKQLARVARLLVNYAHGDWLAALEARARIKIRALTTAMQVGFAVETGAFDEDVCRRFSTAVCAFDRFAKRHHFWRAWTFAIDRL